MGELKEGQAVGTPVEVTDNKPQVKIAADELWALVSIALDSLGGTPFSINTGNRSTLVTKIVTENWEAAPFYIKGRFRKGGKK